MSKCKPKSGLLSNSAAAFLKKTFLSQSEELQKVPRGFSISKSVFNVISAKNCSLMHDNCI